MTVLGWIIFIIFAGCIIALTTVIGYGVDRTAVGVLAGILLSAALLAGMLFYFNGTASGKRAFKSQESNFNNGIQRTVEVYDATGGLIKTYNGKFDVKYDSDRILFDDENGKRHVIYYPTGTVIIDEVDGE